MYEGEKGWSNLEEEIRFVKSARYPVRTKYVIRTVVRIVPVVQYILLLRTMTNIDVDESILNYHVRLVSWVINFQKRELTNSKQTSRRTREPYFKLKNNEIKLLHAVFSTHLPPVRILTNQISRQAVFCEHFFERKQKQEFEFCQTHVKKMIILGWEERGNRVAKREKGT